MSRILLCLLAGSVLLAVRTSVAAGSEGDAARGARVFNACAACHALEPGVQLSGPSLAGVWGRKAGSLEQFLRYSDPLKRSGIMWNAKTLDAWVRQPDALVPGNYMTFPGIKDARARADLVAFLKAAAEGKAPKTAAAPRLPDLKRAPPSAKVTSIRHCRDSYFVTSAAGEMTPFWEFNLRFKTDSSPSGPGRMAPVLTGQGMQGDRAQVVFSQPEEMSRFIREGC